MEIEICYTEPSISSNGEIGFHLVRQTNIGILNKHPASLFLVQSFHPGFVVHQKRNNELQLSKQLCIVILFLKLQLKTKKAKVWLILSVFKIAHKSIWLILCFQKCFFSSVRSSNSHPDLLVTHQHQQHPTFSDNTLVLKNNTF